MSWLAKSAETRAKILDCALDLFLERGFADMAEAIRNGDRAREDRWVSGLALPRNSSWFASHFDEKAAQALKAAYDRTTQDFAQTTRLALEGGVQRERRIDVRVDRYADPAAAPDAVGDFLRGMNRPAAVFTATFFAPLNEAVGVGGEGELDGVFVEADGGLRFIPNSVVALAAKLQPALI